MTRLVIFAALFLSAVAIAAPPEADPIRLPFVEISAPKPPPKMVTTLRAEQLYVIDSDIELQVIASPEGVVSVSHDTGPIKIRGKFVENASGKVTTRNVKGPHVYTVEAITTGKVELLIVRGDGKGAVIRRTLDVSAGEGPIPPPKPDPKPDPAPVKVESVWVIVVEDATAPRTLDTARALNDPFWAALKPKHDFRHYLSTAKPAIDNGYVEQGKRVGFPAVVILDAKDGDVLKAFKLGTVADLAAQVKAVTK